MEVLPDYDQYSKLLKFYSSDVVCTGTEFSQNIKVYLSVDKQIFENFKTRITDAFSGKISFNLIGEGFFPFK